MKRDGKRGRKFCREVIDRGYNTQEEKVKRGERWGYGNGDKK